MAIYEIFSRPILIKYKASLCSCAAWFYFITFLLKFICPFVITYYSQGFWRKVDLYREQPNVLFKHKMLVILETSSSGMPLIWSTYENINEIMKKEVFQSLPDIEHREVDLNKDGKKDELEMSINFPISDQEIKSAKIILIFDYQLSLNTDFRMECAAYVHHSSPLQGSVFTVAGDLTLHQREPLKHTGRDERFNVPVIRDSLENPPYNLEDILLKYFRRNITTTITNSYPVWKTAKVKNGSFVINIFLKYPVETILYQVGFWQLLKWALVQYLAVYTVISFLVHAFRRYTFQHQLVSSVVIDPFKKA